MFPLGIKAMPKTISPTAPKNAVDIARRAARSVPQGISGGLAEQGEVFRTAAVPAGGASNEHGESLSVTLNGPEPVRVSLPHRLPSVTNVGRHPGPQARDEAAAAELTAIASPADLGRLVRAVRERRHFSQQEFADLAGVGRRFLSELENGKPTLELGKVLKVANAAGIVLFARER
jgi:HTH-type transcriptional regulator/antitoxin HipB